MSDIGQDIIAAVRGSAVANPERIYAGKCAYVRNGYPSCIVGHGLWSLNLINADTEDLPENRAAIGSFLEHLGLEVDIREYQWLKLVQAVQDTGDETWGEAVRQADLLYPQ